MNKGERDKLARSMVVVERDGRKVVFYWGQCFCYFATDSCPTASDAVYELEDHFKERGGLERHLVDHCYGVKK